MQLYDVQYYKTDIKELWKKVCKGDTLAFEALFTDYYPRLVNFSSSYIHQREQAEEIVSEVFVKCWVNRINLIHVEKPEVYLFIMAKNASLTYLKRFSNIRVQYLAESNAFQLSTSVGAHNEMERNELFFKMNQAIASLPHQSQMVFKLVKEEGLKYKEVASILNISHRTVQTHLVRAIEKLRAAMLPFIEYRDAGNNTNIIISLIFPFFFFFSS